jgi:hypothetical protein
VTYRQHTIVYGIGCNTRGCDESLIIFENPPTAPWRARAQLDEMAKEAGWSKWGGRSWRHYCSKHEPRSGTKMHQIFGPAREVSSGGE